MEEELKPSKGKVWSYFQQAVAIRAPTSAAVRNRCFFPCFSYEMGYSVLVGAAFFLLYSAFCAAQVRTRVFPRFEISF